MTDALDPKIADLVSCSRGDANARIHEWLDSGNTSPEDLTYVAGFLRTRAMSAATNDWRVGMAALFVAMPTLAITVFSSIAPSAGINDVLPHTLVILAVSAAGVLWTLTFMLVDAVRVAHDTKLLAAVERRLEIVRRTPRSSWFRRYRLRRVLDAAACGDAPDADVRTIRAR